MKRLLFWLITLSVLLALGVAWFWRFNPTVLPEAIHAHLPSYAEVREGDDTHTQTSVAPDTKPVYRWRNAQGMVEYGDRPPAGVKAEKIVIDPNTNIVPMRPNHGSSNTPHAADDEDIIEMID